MKNPRKKSTLLIRVSSVRMEVRKFYILTNGVDTSTYHVSHGCVRRGNKVSFCASSIVESRVQNALILCDSASLYSVQSFCHNVGICEQCPPSRVV